MDANERAFVEHDRAERAHLAARLDEVLARLHELEQLVEAVRLELDDTQPDELG